MVASLHDVVDELVGIDPAALSDVAVADELLAVRAGIDRLEGVFARLAAAAHRRGVGAEDGAQSTAAWLRSRAGMREGDAKAAVEAGELSELLEDTGAAWRAGQISSGAARTIFGARVDGHDETLRASEPILLDLARRGDLRSLRRASAHFRTLALADGSDPGARDGLHMSRTFDGITVLSGELTDAGAETVVTAIHAYTDQPTDDDTRTLRGAPRRHWSRSARSRSSTRRRPAERRPTSRWWSTGRRSPTRASAGPTVSSPARSTPRTCGASSATRPCHGS